jgi:AcrR family transcriptional regulator
VQESAAESEEAWVARVKAAERHGQIVAAARRVLASVGVQATTLRAVAAEAGIPLGTLQYVFPARDQLLRAVIGAVVEDIETLLRAELNPANGLSATLRQGVQSFWHTLVENEVGLQLMQYELTMYALRTEGLGELASWQYGRYRAVITELCEEAARASGERCALGFDALGRLVVAVVDGLILQYVAHPDKERSQRDLTHALDMLILLADPRPVAGIRPHPA